VSRTCLLGWLDGNGVFLWDGDLHWFGGVVLVTLEGSSELDGSQRLKLVRPRSVALLWTRHTLTMAASWAALQSRGAVREACVGAISNRNYEWSRVAGSALCSVQYVCARWSELPYSTLRGARAQVRVERELWCVRYATTTTTTTTTVGGESRGWWVTWAAVLTVVVHVARPYCAAVVVGSKVKQQCGWKRA